MQDISSAKDVGEAVAKVLAGKNAVTVASSDMTHYEPQERAEEKDKEVLKAVEAMDETRFYSSIETLHVTACGYGPIVALITAAKMLGAKEAKLLCYKTSGDINGDYSSVVGYAAVCLTK
jgi:AmmeMemoRadiSam system protein B